MKYRMLLIAVVALATVGAAQAQIIIGLKGEGDKIWVPFPVTQVVKNASGSTVTLIPKPYLIRVGNEQIPYRTSTTMLSAEYAALCNLLGVETLDGHTIWWTPMVAKGHKVETFRKAVSAAVQGYPDIAVTTGGPPRGLKK